MKNSLLATTLLIMSANACATLTFDDVARLTDTPETLSGAFEQTKFLAEFDAEIASQGTFSYQRDQEIIWRTMSPIQSELTMTPNYIVSRQNGQELARLDARDNAAVSILSRIFFAILSAQWSELETYFSLDGEIGPEQWQLQLTPSDSAIASVVNKVELWGDTLVQRVRLHEKNGDFTDIQFKAGAD